MHAVNALDPLRGTPILKESQLEQKKSEKLLYNGRQYGQYVKTSLPYLEENLRRRESISLKTFKKVRGRVLKIKNSTDCLIKMLSDVFRIIIKKKKIKHES